MKSLQSSLGIGALALLFLGLVILNNLLFDKARLDLTENQIYSISDGTKSVIGKVDETINLYFFFSEKNSEGITHIRNYADRVKSLLEEYELYSDGKIKLHVIDPEPFSEAEDRAAEFGLTAATVNVAGDSLYFGLGASNTLDDQETIAFFDPSKESFLEYDLSKLIYNLSDPKKLRLGIISDLPYQGTQNPNPMMRSREGEAPWVFYEQLQQMYELEQIGASETELPEALDVLMLAHPKDLSQELQYAIDQFVVNGGKVLAFIDPHAESAGADNMVGQNASDIDALLSGWGIGFDSAQVVLDAASALEIRLPTGGQGKHYGYLGLTAENLDADDVTTSSLNIINGASFGHFTKPEGAEYELIPLVFSSEHSDLKDANTYGVNHDPRLLQRGFEPKAQVYNLAVRINGKLTSAFDQAPVEGVEHVASTDTANLILVADSDMLADNFWVQKQSFFGQAVYNPFANNGDFISNSVENLSGSSDLISVRARGKFSRPFDVVESLTVAAEAEFRTKEQELQQRLQKTEEQLRQLQSQQSETGAVVLTKEQQAAIDEFVQQKLEIRKELREVRHQLDKDIDALGSKLKLINVAVMPILLTLLLIFIGRIMRNKAVV